MMKYCNQWPEVKEATCTRDIHALVFDEKRQGQRCQNLILRSYLVMVQALPII